MSTQALAIMTLSVVAMADLARSRFVGWDGNTAAAGGSAMGIARCDTATGDMAPVDTVGTAVVISGGAFIEGAALEVGDEGTAVLLDEGQKVARALQAASGAGQRIEVLLIPN